MKRHFPFFLVYFLFPIFFYGQPFQYSIFSLENKFSKGLIKSIAVDNQGFIWMASDEGVTRYDGAQSLFFKNELSGGFAKAFCKRKNGTLLVLHDFGLTEIVSESDTTYFKKLLPGENRDSPNALFYPKTIYEDRQGIIWIGENQSIVRYSNGKIEKFHFGNNSTYGIILNTYSFTEDEDNTLWVISHRGSLYYFDALKNDFVECVMPTDITLVNHFHFVEKNKFYAGTISGLFEIETNSFKEVIRTKKLPSPDNISCGIITDHEEIYLGTWETGAYRADLKKKPLDFEKIEPLPSDEIIGFFFDKNNGVWVTGSENVALITPVFFSALNLGESEIVKSIQLLERDRFLITKGDYLIMLQKINTTWKEVFSFLGPEQSPTAAYEDEDGIWFGDLSGHVFFYNYETESTRKIEEIKFSSDPIEHIIKDSVGNIWIAGNTTHGLIRIATDGSHYYYNNGGLNTSKIIYETIEGDLFVGGGNSKSYLFKFDPKKDAFEDLSVKIDFAYSKNFSVEDIILTPEGNLWLATFDGVLEFNLSDNISNSEKIKRIDLRKVPLDEPAKALALSENETIWVSTTSGLISYNKLFSLLFNKAAGLPGNNLSPRGLSIDKEKNLLVATTRGLGSVHQPILNNRMTPIPIFKQIKVNGIAKLFKQLNRSAFPFHTAFEIEFLSPSYPTESISYQTRILGLDSIWSASISNPKTLLTGIPAGEYTFQVRAQQDGGLLWSQPASFHFSITMPWYQRGWAIFLLLILGILFVYGVARLYNLNLLRQNERLEKTIQERTTEINKQKNEIIEYKNKQVTTYTLQLIQKNEALKELRGKIYKSMRTSDKATYNQLKSFLGIIDFSFRNDKEWTKFKLFFEEVHAGFFEALMTENPNITPQDLRHCALIRLNLSIQEVATIMGISTESVKTSRFRLRKKMDISSQQELVDYIMKI